MIIVAATDLKNKLGQIIDQARREPVLVQSHGRDTVVILDHVEFARLRQLAMAQSAALVAEPSASAKFLISLAGTFDSGQAHTSENVKTPENRL